MKKIRLLSIALFLCCSLSCCSTGSNMEEVQPVTALVSEVATKGVNYESQKVLLQYTKPIIDDKTFKLDYLEEGIISHFLVFSIKEPWTVYSDVDIILTWYDALGGIVCEESAHFDYVCGDKEYLLKSKKNMYRYLSVKVVSHSTENVMANIAQGKVAVDSNRKIVSDYFEISAVHTSEATVEIYSSMQPKVYVNLIRNGVVVDSSWVTNGDEIETYRNVEYVVPFIVQK